MRQIQAQSPQHTQDYQVPQNHQPTQTQSFNVPDRYAEQMHVRREWEEKMERLNEKYCCHASMWFLPEVSYVVITHEARGKV